MKTFKYFSKLICVMLLLIGLFVLVKQKLISPKDILIIEPIVKPITIPEIALMLHKTLNELIDTKEFMKEYGASKSHPSIITRYYFLIIRHPDFIINFLDGINIAELRAQSPNSDVFLSEIKRLFYLYVKESQNHFEYKIMLPVSLITDTYFLINGILLRNLLFNLRPADIITPRAARWNQEYNIWQKKQIIPCSIFIRVIIIKSITDSG